MRDKENVLMPIRFEGLIYMGKFARRRNQDTTYLELCAICA